MKTLFLAAFLISGTAYAQVNIDQALQIRNQKKIQTAPGMVVGRIDVEAAKNAAASVGGTVSIHFSKNESLQLNQSSAKSGGVIIGSGTDGRKKDVTIVPPLRPSMSITVSARNGSLNESSEFCVRLKNLESQKESNCAKTGTRLRILKSGAYLVYLKGENALGISSLEVNVNPGDNLIIPTREIQIGAYSEIRRFFLYADYTSNDELKKLRSIGTRSLLEAYFERDFLKDPLRLDGYWEKAERYIISELAGEQFSNFLKNNLINDFGTLEVMPSSFPRLIQLSDESIHAVTYNTRSLNTFIGDSSFYSEGFFNVLPGTYGIQWLFEDRQIDFTKGIVVE